MGQTQGLAIFSHSLSQSTRSVLATTKEVPALVIHP